MAPVGWRLSPDGHLIKSSLAGSDQKLFILPSDRCKIGRYTSDVNSYPEVTMEQWKQAGTLSASPLFFSVAAMPRQICGQETALLLFLHCHCFRALQLRIKKSFTRYKYVAVRRCKHR